MPTVPTMPSDLREERARLRERLKPVVGHRGAALHAPENTLASIRKAAELGARWVEFDVKLSRDGVPFLLHDSTVDRTTDGTGRAVDLDFADLQERDAGSWFGAAFKGERLPGLASVVELLLQLDLEANVEIKPCRGHEAVTARTVMEALSQLWPKDREPPLISSFSRVSLLAAKETAPGFPRGLLLERLEPTWSRQMAEAACATLHIDHKGLSAAELDLLTSQGIPVLCYTVNHGKRARELIDGGASAIITDAPDRVLAAPSKG